MFVPALALDALLRGTAPASFARGPSGFATASFVLLLSGPPGWSARRHSRAQGLRDDVVFLGEDGDVALFLRQGDAAVRTWSSAVCRAADQPGQARFDDANDYLLAFDAEHDPGTPGVWFEACARPDR